jgi:hypothetical protein
MQQVACKYRTDTGERRIAMRNRVRRNNVEQYETLKALENPAQFPHLRKSLIYAMSSAGQNRARAKAQSASFNFLNALSCAAASSGKEPIERSFAPPWMRALSMRCAATQRRLGALRRALQATDRKGAQAARLALAMASPSTNKGSEAIRSTLTPFLPGEWTILTYRQGRQRFWLRRVGLGRAGQGPAATAAPRRCCRHRRW